MSVETRLADLERQLKALTLQLRGSPGVSTSWGAMSIRSMQVGFAAELTSTYDSSTGYAWKRLKLNPPDFDNPGIQPTGLLAFDVSGSTTLTVGTPVWMEPSPDAQGWIFTVSGGGGGGSGVCSALIGLIREGNCFVLSISAGVGSCSCVSAQSTRMSWDSENEVMASEDYVYGCAPGVTTTFCPDGAPLKYRIVMAGFTGGSTGFNGTYTFTWSTGENWEVSAGPTGITGFLRQTSLGNWTVEVTNGSNIPKWTLTGATDCCTDLVITLFDGGGTTTPPASITAEPVTGCGLGTPYTAWLDICDSECDGPQPRMRLIPGAESGAAVITLSRNGCINRGGQFSTSDPIFCTGDFEFGCLDNLVTFNVSCGCTTIVCDQTVETPICLILQDVPIGSVDPTYVDIYFRIMLDCLVEGSFEFIGWMAEYFGTDNVYWPVFGKLSCPGGIEYRIVPTVGDTSTFFCGMDVTPYFAFDTYYYGSLLGTFPNLVGDWNYVSPGPSVPPGTAITNDSDCRDPRIPTYNCIDSSSCVDPGDGTGTYDTLEACQVACGGPDHPSWNCLEDGSCVDPGDGSGTFGTLVACQEACGTSPDTCCDTELSGHPDLEATYLGFSATLAWVSGMLWEGTTQLGEHDISVECVDGVWRITWWTMTNQAAATQGCGNMFAVFTSSLPPKSVTVVHP